MPYEIKGKAVYKKDTGELVGHSASPKRYKKILDAVAHGFKPTNKKTVITKRYAKKD